MIRYRRLFDVEIAHDYFLSRGAAVLEAQTDADRAALTRLYSVQSFLEIVPDERTAAVLAGHKMVFKTSAAGFTVAVQLDPSATDVRPMVSPGADFRLTFVLRLRDPRFANYTELGPASTGFYRFGNDSQNSTAAINFLSARVPAFVATRRYVAGEIRAEAAAPTFDLFLAVRDTGPSAAPIPADWRRIPPDTFSASATFKTGAVVLSANRLFRALVDNPGSNLANAAEWQPIGVLGNQYASAADALLPVSGLFNVNIADLALSRATVRVFPSGGTAMATEQTFAAEQGTLRQIQIDLRALAPGRWRVEILDAGTALVRVILCYLAPLAGTENWFGVIDVGRGAGDFALLNNDGTLRQPHYVLRFLNRATRWRYIFPAAQPVGTGAEVAPEGGDTRILVTSGPLPLTRFGSGSRLQADSPATATVSEEILLPVPEVNQVRRQNAEWFSEIRVPNLTVGP